LVTQNIVEFAGVLYPHREVLQKQTSIRSFKYAELANILLPQTTSGGDFTGSTFGFLYIEIKMAKVEPVERASKTHLVAIFIK
jgi:hypothetical protein